MVAVTAQCPYCGEEVEVTVEEIGASSERFVEDCSVCCRPWTVFVTRDSESDDGDVAPQVSLAREDD